MNYKKIISVFTGFILSSLAFIFFSSGTAHAEACRVLYIDGFYQDAGTIKANTDACKQLQYSELAKYTKGHPDGAINPKTKVTDIAKINCECPPHGVLTFDNTGETCEALCKGESAKISTGNETGTTGATGVAASRSTGAAAGSGLIPCGNAGQNPCTLCDFFVMFQGLMQWGLDILFILAGAGIVISGILYIISAGDPGLMTKAKGYIKMCIIGLVIVLSAWLIVNTVMWIMGATRQGIWYNINC